MTILIFTIVPVRKLHRAHYLAGEACSTLWQSMDRRIPTAGPVGYNSNRLATHKLQRLHAFDFHTV